MIVGFTWFLQTHLRATYVIEFKSKNRLILIAFIYVLNMHSWIVDIFIQIILQVNCRYIYMWNLEYAMAFGAAVLRCGACWVQKVLEWSSPWQDQGQRWAFLARWWLGVFPWRLQEQYRSGSRDAIKQLGGGRLGGGSSGCVILSVCNAPSLQCQCDNALQASLWVTLWFWCL